MVSLLGFIHKSKWSPIYDINVTLHNFYIIKKWITQGRYVQIFGVDKIKLVNKDTESDNMLDNIMKVEDKNGLKKLRSIEVIDNLKER